VAKANWDRAVLDLQTAPIRSQIDAEKYKLAVEEAEANYKQLVYESSLVEESQRSQIRASELNRDQSRIELQRAESNVQKMSMKAPMNGIVVMQSLFRNGQMNQFREGDNVGPGQTFMQIVDPSSMVLNATINQVDAGLLRLGMKARVRLDAYADVELPGTLVGIGAMSKASTFRAGYVGMIPLRFKIEGRDSRIIPDLTGSAEVQLSTVENTVLAPRGSVFEENGKQFVFLQGPNGWAKQPVEVEASNHTTAAIRSGLRKGDVIALQRPI
jgi:biotin carboxyl carrier protein